MHKSVGKAANFTLQCLGLVAKGIVFLNLHPHEQAIAISDGMEGLKRFRELRNQKLLRKRINYLKRKQYIKEQRMRNRIAYVLTDRGQFRLIKHSIRQAPKRKEGFVAVIFDVPRTHNAARGAFRKFLKENGFWRLQHSVWITDRDVYIQLCDFVRMKKLEKWINIFVVLEAFRTMRP